MENLDKFIFEDIQAMEDENCNFKMVMYEKIKTPYGKELFSRVARNTTLIGGTQKLAQLFLKGNPQVSSGSYNTIITVDSAIAAAKSGTFPASSIATTGNSYAFGFLFGKDGDTTNIVHIDRYKKGFLPEDVIPLRMIEPSIENPKEATLRENYGMRMVTNDWVYYYLKKPESIIFKNMTKSGVALDESGTNGNIDSQSISEDVVSVATFHVKLELDMVNDIDDMSEYFINHPTELNVNLRRFGSVMLVYGDEVLIPTANDAIDFKNVIVTNRINTLLRPLGKYGTGDYYFNIYFK